MIGAILDAVARWRWRRATRNSGPVTLSSNPVEVMVYTGGIPVNRRTIAELLKARAYCDEDVEVEVSDGGVVIKGPRHA